MSMYVLLLAGWTLGAPMVKERHFQETFGDQMQPLASFAHHGSVHRELVALNHVFNTYRLVLVELQPALVHLVEFGTHPQTGPTSDLPAPLHTSLALITSSLGGRIPSASLHPTMHLVHERAKQALKSIVQDQTMGGSATYLRQFKTAIDLLLQQTEIWLESIEAPGTPSAQAVDQIQMYEELEQALDDLGQGEREIQRARNGQNQEQIATAYRRTEQALGHVLDIWATARSYGIDFMREGTHLKWTEIRVPQNLPTKNLKNTLALIRKRWGYIEALIAKLSTPPPQIDLAKTTAALFPVTTKEIRVEIRWPQIEDRVNIVRRIRIYRRNDLEQIRQNMLEQYVCGDAIKQEELDDNLVNLDTNNELIDVLEPQAGVFRETLDTWPVAPPIYTVVSVNAFGQESKPVTIRPEAIAEAVPPISALKLNYIPIEPKDDEFYRSANDVHITWKPSLNDTKAHPKKHAWIEQWGLARVQSYALLRQIGSQDFIKITELPPGSKTYLDRPSSDAFGRGVRYRVLTIDDHSLGVLPSEGCATSNLVQFDLTSRLELARHGYAWLNAPTHTQLKRQGELIDPSLHKALQTRFENVGILRKKSLLTRWWSQLSANSKELFVNESFHSDQDESASTLSLSTTHKLWLRLWSLQDNDPDVSAQIDRCWQVLSPNTRNERTKSWLATLEPAYRQWLLDQSHQTTQHQAQKTLRMITWWTDRDPVEKNRIEGWWNELDSQSKGSYKQRWFDGLVEAAKLQVRNPSPQDHAPKDWLKLLQEPPRTLGQQAWRDLLVWLAWHELSEDEQFELLPSEINWAGRFLSRVQYLLRPLDLKTQFRGTLVFLWTVFATCISTWLVLAWRETKSLR
jgi:hypothetical protein